MRKTEIFVVPKEAGNRDSGKRFLITEMPAMKAERWAMRALLAISRSGVDIGVHKNAGFAGIAIAGLKALENLNFEEARPLLDEMLECVQVMPDPKNPEVVRPLMLNEMEGDDFEEVATILKIRERIFMLHAAFFLKEKQSKKG